MRRLKKYLMVALTLLTLTISAIGLASCDFFRASKGLAFTLLEDGTYEVSGIGTCMDENIVIPSKYEGKAVTAIGKSAFSGAYRLTEVEIPDSVTTIGESAFRECFSLANLKIPNSVTTIEKNAFRS